MNSWVRITAALSHLTLTFRTITLSFKAWPNNWTRAWTTRYQCQTSRWTSNCPSKSSNWPSNYKVARWTLTRATSSIRRMTSIHKTRASAMATMPHLNNNRPSKRPIILKKTGKCSIASQSPSCSRTKYECLGDPHVTWRNSFRSWNAIIIKTLSPYKHPNSTYKVSLAWDQAISTINLWIITCWLNITPQK